MAGQEPAGARQSAVTPRIVVLLVDDQAFVASVLERLLSTEADIELHHCQDATKAVVRATELRPSLILQDLVMPDVDGLTLVGLFRANDATAAIPLVVLSGSDEPELRASAEAAGAVDYLVKLPAKNDLIQCIRRYGTGSTTARADAAQDAVASAGAQADAGQTLDPSIVATFREAGVPSFALRLFDQFVQEAESRTVAIQTAAGQQDVETARTAAHSLRGSSQIIGATRLGALCARLERDLKSDPGGGISPDLVTAIGNELAHVRHALAQERQHLMGLAR